MDSNTTESPRKAGWFKEHILPLLLIFLIPGFSWWFFDRAETQMDEMVRRDVLDSIRRDSGLTGPEEAAALEFYQQVRISKVMASFKPEAAGIQQTFEPVKWRYATFRWSKRIALACLGLSLFALASVGLGVAWSLRSQAALYQALRFGWPVLRGIAVFQVIGQGALAVALSFWVTALWFELYSIKLIAAVAIVALGGVVVIVKAILNKPEGRFEQNGEEVSREEAPALWQRVSEIAAKLGAAPPDRIIAGIDASFYVTEHEIWIGDEKRSGRTLFVSLPLLGVLTVEEADAVLAHEMAHFSGNDTLWSRRISPFLQDMGRYLGALYSAGLSRVVFHFLHFFWKLYQYSLGRMSRSREFRADRIAAENTSAGAVARALVKIGAYCRYRNQTEGELLEQRKLDPNLELSDRLDRGFATYLTEFTSDPDSALSETPHPFDTHPPLAGRMEALGLSPAEVLRNPEVLQPVVSTWRNAVVHAAAIEERLWGQQERLMKEFHELKSAWTLMPETDEEIAIIAKHFPRMSFSNNKGSTAVIDHDGITLSDWPNPIPFSGIDNVELKESLGKNYLHVNHRIQKDGSPETTKFRAEIFKNEDGDLQTAFANYYGRYKTAVSHRENAGETVQS